jgi:O-antigen/teichoic acid export membrane protein
MIFIIFTTFGSISSLQANVFIAFREAKYLFIQGLVTVLRIAILPLLIVFGAFGIYSSAGFASLLALIIGNMLILKVYSSYKPIPVIKNVLLMI